MRPEDRRLWGVIHEHRDRLPMFVVYDHPADHPDHFVGRLWLTLPEAVATNVVVRDADLDVIRRYLANDLGLTKLDRSPTDDPAILETWI